MKHEVIVAVLMACRVKSIKTAIKHDSAYHLIQLCTFEAFRATGTLTHDKRRTRF
jgi:hypothetical protein